MTHIDNTNALAEAKLLSGNCPFRIMCMENLFLMHFTYDVNTTTFFFKNAPLC